jgi:hypothetical protein
MDPVRTFVRHFVSARYEDFSPKVIEAPMSVAAMGSRLAPLLA